MPLAWAMRSSAHVETNLGWLGGKSLRVRPSGSSFIWMAAMMIWETSILGLEMRGRIEIRLPLGS